MTTSYVGLAQVTMYLSIIVFFIDIGGLLYVYHMFNEFFTFLIDNVVGFVLLPSFFLFIAGYLVQYTYNSYVAMCVKTIIPLNFTLILVYTLLFYIKK